MNRIHIFVLLLISTICSLSSRLSAEETVKAKVPFAFSVADRTLPAGEYRMVHDGTLLHIENCDDHQSVTLVVSLSAPSRDKNTYLSFDQVNGSFFLRRVVNPHATNTLELAAFRNKNRHEKRTGNSSQASIGR